MIVLIGGEKGGAGKSTIACNLAVFLASQAKDVLLLDADPQKTSSTWAYRRNKITDTNLPKLNNAELIASFKNHVISKVKPCI